MSRGSSDIQGSLWKSYLFDEERFRSIIRFIANIYWIQWE